MTTIQSLRQDLLDGPDLFTHKLEPAAQTLLFVRLSRDAFAQASFLDDRILTPQTQGAWYKHASIETVLDGAAPDKPTHFIFHAGHVGSTLLSRLMESAGGVLALREPLPLRTLAELGDDRGKVCALVSDTAFDRMLGLQLLLWSRGYSDTRAVVIKATSATARLGPLLLAAAPQARAIHLSLPAEPYLATLLAGENTPNDLRGMGRERFRRAHRLAGVEPVVGLHALSLGELAALTWCAETLTRAQLLHAGGGRVLALDFERLLAEPAKTLGAAFSHFALQVTPNDIETIEASSLWRRYAKAPETEYSPQLRAEILAEARSRHGDEIRKGLAWIDAFARSSASAAAAFASTP